MRRFHVFLTFPLLLFAAIPAFTQNDISEREQGLLTLDPFWRQALGGAVLSLPSVQAQSIVAALDGGNIKAYSTSGNPLWNYSARGKISPYVTRSTEGTSYFSRTNGTLIAVNRSGRELWRRNLESPLSAGVIIGWDGRLFVPTEKKISCFTASGSLLWTKTFEASYNLPPKLDRSGGIIFALQNNEIYRIDPFGNTRVWNMLPNIPVVLLSIEEHQIMALYTDGTMEIHGNNEEWNTAEHQGGEYIPPTLSSGPLAAINRGGYIAAVTRDGRAALVSLDEKKILWYGDSHITEFIKNGGSPEMEAEMLFDERGIYVLSKNGATGFTHDGKRLWFMILQNAAAIPAFSEDGILYSGGKDWILYTYKVENRSLPAANSIYGPAPEGSYGTGSPHTSYMYNIPLFEYEIRAKLEQITAAVNKGQVGANEIEWTTFLLMLCASQEQVQLRIKALNLLGKIGSKETTPWLVNIFRRETEPLLRAAAASAIGAIGADSDGSAMQTFMSSLIYGGGIRDEQVLMAIISAAGALCRFSGPPLSEAGIKILNMLSENSYPPVVRRQAGRELTSLR